MPRYPPEIPILMGSWKTLYARWILHAPGAIIVHNGLRSEIRIELEPEALVRDREINLFSDFSSYALGLSDTYKHPVFEGEFPITKAAFLIDFPKKEIIQFVCIYFFNVFSPIYFRKML